MTMKYFKNLENNPLEIELTVVKDLSELSCMCKVSLCGASKHIEVFKSDIKTEVLAFDILNYMYEVLDQTTKMSLVLSYKFGWDEVIEEC